jgi:four helix bundle protein
MVQDFRNLKVWQKAHALALAVYKDTMAFPREEVYGLTSQMRRSATSIPSNIEVKRMLAPFIVRLKAEG